MRLAWRRLGRRPLTKRDEELAHWNRRLRAEGDLGTNRAHYEFLYTEQFGLRREHYAGKRVLDIGCGPRGSLEWATEARERVGIDPLVADYRTMGIDAHAMTYVETGAESIPYPDGHFDIVTSFNSLDHVDDVDAAIREITRVTAPGGTMLLIVEVNHPPSLSEPHCLEWDLLARFDGWEVLEERRTGVRDDHDIHHSFHSGHPVDPDGPGVIGARLRRR